MRPRLNEQEQREMISALRARAAAFRRQGYFASADALEDRAARHEWWLQRLEDERAERMCGPDEGAQA